MSARRASIVARRKKAKRGNMFAGLNAQIRMAMNVAASNKTDGLRQIFLKFDRDGNGMVDKREFLIGCNALGVQITAEEVDLMWPYFDLDNSGEIDMEEFLVFAEGKTKPIGGSTVQLGGKRDKFVLESITKAQRVVLEEHVERKPSMATDEKVQAILGKPLWSLTQMQQKVRLLPLSDSNLLKDQEWLLDCSKPIPLSPLPAKLKRNWRGTFFLQVKDDSQLRVPTSPIVLPIGLAQGSLSKKQAAVAWDGYRDDRHKLYEEVRKNEEIKAKALKKKIADLEHARQALEDIEEAKRAQYGF
jgi:hypothetical protein